MNSYLIVAALAMMGLVVNPQISVAQGEAPPVFRYNDEGLYKKAFATVSSSYLKKIPLSNGLGLLKILTESGDVRIGIVNKQGKVLIKPAYVSVGDPSGEYIYLKSSCGYYDFYHRKFGAISVPDCDSFFVHQNNLFVSVRQQWGVYISGKDSYKEIPPSYKSLQYQPGRLDAQYFSKWTVMENGKAVATFNSDSLFFINDTLLVLQRSGKGIIAHISSKEYSSNFELAPMPEVSVADIAVTPTPTSTTRKFPDSAFQEVKQSGASVFIVRQREKYGMVDSLGKTLLASEYDSIRGPFADSIFIVHKGKSIGIANRSGYFLYELSDRFSRVFDYKEGRAMMQKEGRYGFIDGRGNVRVAPQYLQARHFKEGAAAVVIKGKWGFIDGNEDILVQPLYDEVKDFKNGMALCRTGNQWCFVGKDGKRVSTLTYDTIYESTTGKWILVKKGKLGLADVTGRELLGVRYDYLQDIGNGMVIGRKGTQWGVVDYKENFVYPFEYDAISYYNNSGMIGLMRKGAAETIVLESGKK